jgi:hypothetical protein
MDGQRFTWGIRAEPSRSVHTERYGNHVCIHGYLIDRGWLHCQGNM